MVVVGLCLSSTQLLAYDEDTHFYSTYAMARHAGIKHEVAEKIALSAQWMDESFLSDPTSMMVLPITGIHKRRLLHFPSLRRGGSLSAAAQQKVLGFDNFEKTHLALINWAIKFLGYEGDAQQLQTLNLWTATEADDPFASELFMEGLKEGDLMKA